MIFKIFLIKIFYTLTNTDENVFEHCTNLFGVVKLILLKVSVGAIVIQGLAESFLYSSGTSPFKDDDAYNAEDKTLRAYCNNTCSIDFEEIKITISKYYFRMPTQFIFIFW